MPPAPPGRWDALCSGPIPRARGRSHIEINGHAAIVTGAASGLGRATALALASLGAKVACLDMEAGGARATADETGGIAIPCDITDPGGVEDALAAARAEHGPARILVSCAGIDTPGRIVGRDGLAAPLERFVRVVSVNLIGTYNVLRLAVAEMKRLDPLESGERGVVVNTASIVGYEGQVGHTAYAASKAGIMGMTLPAARELSRSGIRVNTIAPGLFDTPMMGRLPAEAREALGASVPFPARLGKPEEYAELVVHFIRNAMMNGEVVRLDGALRLPPV